MSGFMLHGLGDCTPEQHCGCLNAAPTDSTDTPADVIAARNPRTET